MRVKELFVDQFQIVAVMDGDDCPTENFITEGEESTRAMREGLLNILMSVAKGGWENVSSKSHHEANKKNKIHELIKGDLRLFYFKGVGNQIAVCTTGVRKTGNKADTAAVTQAAKIRFKYFEAIEAKTLQVVGYETE